MRMVSDIKQNYTCVIRIFMGINLKRKEKKHGKQVSDRNLLLSEYRYILYVERWNFNLNFTCFRTSVNIPSLSLSGE